MNKAIIRAFLILSVSNSYGQNLCQNIYSNQLSTQVPNDIGILKLDVFVPPVQNPSKSAWIDINQIPQEHNLCVPTSASEVLNFYGYEYTPREIKEWSLGRDYTSGQSFHDFTTTFFVNLISGLKSHDIFWDINVFSNDLDGFASGLKKIKNELDGHRPVIVDTNLYEGHTVVVAGYDIERSVLVIVDSFIASPGIREISESDFEKIWNSTGSGSKNRGAIFTSQPSIIH